MRDRRPPLQRSAGAAGRDRSRAVGPLVGAFAHPTKPVTWALFDLSDADSCLIPQLPRVVSWVVERGFEGPALSTIRIAKAVFSSNRGNVCWLMEQWIRWNTYPIPVLASNLCLLVRTGSQKEENGKQPPRETEGGRGWG